VPKTKGSLWIVWIPKKSLCFLSLYPTLDLTKIGLNAQESGHWLLLLLPPYVGMINNNIMESFKKALVLFSGGRDSSAAAVEMIRAGYSVRLFTYQMKELIGPRGDSAPDIRHFELSNTFPKKIDENRIIVKNLYLLKKLAIEKTNISHVVYPIAATLAIHTSAILYCLENDIHHIACGYSGYQAKLDRYIEQRKDFFELMKLFLQEYGIKYHTPIIEKSKEEVIDILDQCGVSSNSLESKSIFIGGPFEINKVLEFWNESILICREYIKKMRSFHDNKI